MDSQADLFLVGQDTYFMENIRTSYRREFRQKTGPMLSSKSHHSKQAEIIQGEEIERMLLIAEQNVVGRSDEGASF